MDGYRYYNSQGDDVSCAYDFATSTDWSGVSLEEVIAGVIGQTIYIQAIMLSVLTDNAATQQWQDNATVPVPIAKSKASPGLGPLLWDFGPKGTPLTEGKSLYHLMSAAGMAGRVTITAYRRVTATNPS
jgi:hypothetical protein